MPSELPPPLPAGERTVGQLVAESIRAYGNQFWRSLALGLPLALIVVILWILVAWSRRSAFAGLFQQ